MHTITDGQCWHVLVNNKMLLCIVDYYSKFPIRKNISSVAVDDLVHMAKRIFAEYGLPKKASPDGSKNVTPDTESLEAWWTSSSP